MKIASENVGYGWIVSSRTSTGISARTASVSWPSHSPASGPDGDGADEHAAPTIGCELHEARSARSLVRREPAAGDLVPRRDDVVPVHHADARHLRIREDGRRDRAIVGPDVAAGDVRRSDARLVLAEVREQPDPGRVADRPDAVARSQPLVHRDAPS